MNQQNFGFVEFASAGDAEYAAKVMNMIKLFGKSIRVNKVCRCITMDSCIDEYVLLF